MKIRVLILLVSILLLYGCKSEKHSTFTNQFTQLKSYTISCPVDWNVNDKNNWNIYISNPDNWTFVQVQIVNINSADTIYELFQILMKIYQFESLESPVQDNSNKMQTYKCVIESSGDNYQVLITIHRGEQFYYVIFGFAQDAGFQKNKDEIVQVMESFQVEEIAGSIIEDQVSDLSATFTFEHSWLDNNAAFSFSTSVLADSGDELTHFNSSQLDFFFVDTINADYRFIFWSRLFQDMFDKNYNRLDIVVEWFIQQQNKENWSRQELLYQIVKFVQYIKYYRPMKIDKLESIDVAELDFLSPLAVFKYGKGDCDTKSLLLVILLKKSGYDACLFYSDYYDHVMTGVSLEDVNGEYIEFADKKYLFVESIYPWWDIGQLPRQFKDKSKWRLISIF